MPSGGVRFGTWFKQTGFVLLFIDVALFQQAWVASQIAPLSSWVNFVTVAAAAHLLEWIARTVERTRAARQRLEQRKREYLERLALRRKP